MQKATFNLLTDICNVFDINLQLLLSTKKADFEQITVLLVAYNILRRTKRKSEIARSLNKDRTTLYHYEKLLKEQYKLFKYAIEKYENEKSI